jgi:hypothetical protein
MELKNFINLFYLKILALVIDDKSATIGEIYSFLSELSVTAYGLRCGPHTLQLAVTDQLKSQE